MQNCYEFISVFCQLITKEKLLLISHQQECVESEIEQLLAIRICYGNKLSWKDLIEGKL